MPHRYHGLTRTVLQEARGRDGRQDGVVTFLCKLGDNGVVWKILEFWRTDRDPPPC